ncbi:hypothetical protein AB4Z29_24945 [Paenibacillus sp. 2TAB23]|uniref:hypothetical protein n=1 Tax=Paenibacillus sp. 2TAB23 TaxID=3233004 RepID=UPI003F96708F
MTKKYNQVVTNSKNQSDFETIRTPHNSHVIDSAIRNGKTVGEAAIEIVKAGLHLSPEEIEQKSVEAIVAYANEYAAQRDPYVAARMKSEGLIPDNSSTGDEDVDIIVAEIQSIMNSRK